MPSRAPATEFLRYLLICSIPPLLGWWVGMNPVPLYDNDAPPGNAFIEIMSTLLGLGFGTGILFIPIHWMAATAGAFRAVTLPVMACISLVSTFITFGLIVPGDYLEYLQSKGLFWVFLGMTITCATLLWRYYGFRRAEKTGRGDTANGATPTTSGASSESEQRRS